MKNRDLVETFKVISTLENSGEKYPSKFTYMISKNKTKIQTTIEAIQKASQPSQEAMEFEKKRIQICQELCEKDENNKPKIENGQFVFSEENQKIADEQINALREEYKGVDVEQQKRSEEINKILDEEVDSDINFHKIPLDLFPNLTVSQMNALVHFVKEEEGD